MKIYIKLRVPEDELKSITFDKLSINIPKDEVINIKNREEEIEITEDDYVHYCFDKVGMTRENNTITLECELSKCYIEYGIWVIDVEKEEDLEKFLTKGIIDNIEILTKRADMSKKLSKKIEFLSMDIYVNNVHYYYDNTDENIYVTNYDYIGEDKYESVH